MNKSNASRLNALQLMLCALSVTGCATTLPPPASSCPRLPASPSASTPQPSKPYSEHAQQLLREWRVQLQATPLTR